MMSETCCCGFCQEATSNCAGLDVPNGEWLEEMGDMILAAVERMGKVQTVSADCCGRMIGA